MNSASATFPAPRVSADLAHAFGGVWRLTWRRLLLPGHWLTLAIGLGVLALLCAGGPRRGRPDEFVGWAANFYVTFLVPALAFIAAGGAMRDELKAGTVDYVLTRPVPRPAFLGFKFIAHTVCTQIDFLFAFAVVLGFAAAHDVPGLPGIAVKLLFGQALLITAFSAFGFLCGVLTTRYIIVGLAYAAVIEAGVGQIPTQLSRLSMTHQVRDLLASWLGRAENLTSAPSLLGTTGALGLFCLLTLGVAAALFTLREFAGPAES
jgi:ABC-type transport system involved in multi-copper enzyme maturation permease subunit